MTFDDAFTRLLGHEGGYVNHPSDPGGETIWGITARVARAQGYTGDMRAMPQSVAKDIYRRMYWAPVRADELPRDIRFDVFDAAVNSGVRQAALWLQRSVGAVADGVIGPQTIAAANSARNVKARYNAQRLRFMTDLPTWGAFGRGWARRIADNLMESP